MITSEYPPQPVFSAKLTFVFITDASHLLCNWSPSLPPPPLLISLITLINSSVLTFSSYMS